MKKLILIVEDDLDILDSAKLFLEMEGFEVASAHNGQEAMDFLRQSPVRPSLILLDLMMPIKDGFDFRNEQLESPFASIPVVVMTAEGRWSERKDQLKAVATVKKPFDLDRLIEVVRQVS